MSSAEYHAFRTVPLSPAEEKAAPSAPWLANPAKYVDLLLAGLGLWLAISLIGLLEIVVPFVRTHENIADFLTKPMDGQRGSFLCHALHRHERTRSALGARPPSRGGSRDSPACGAPTPVEGGRPSSRAVSARGAVSEGVRVHTFHVGTSRVRALCELARVIWAK